MKSRGATFTLGVRTSLQEALLPFDSIHSKILKKSIATSCLADTIRKLRVPTRVASSERQVTRLQKAGFQESPIHCLFRRASYNRFKPMGEKTIEARKEESDPTGLWFCPTFTGCRIIALRYELGVVFSPKKLSRLCRTINNLRGKGCEKKHGRASVQ